MRLQQPYGLVLRVWRIMMVKWIIKIIYRLSNCVATLSVWWCTLLCQESDCTVHNWNLKLSTGTTYFKISKKFRFSLEGLTIGRHLKKTKGLLYPKKGVNVDWSSILTCWIKPPSLLRCYTVCLGRHFKELWCLYL